MQKEKFKTWDIVIQIFEDLTTKDTYRTAKLSYSYLANQLGHIALGYIVAALANSGFRTLEALNCALNLSWFPIGAAANYWAFAISAFIWTCVELLYIRKVFKLKVNELEKPKKYINRDVAMDLVFFYFGASLIFYFGLIGNQVIIATVVHLIIAGIMFYFVMKWYKKKMCQQYIRLPFHKSLMDCKVEFESAASPIDEVAEINRIKKEAGKGHYIFHGGKSVGKTSLAVGMALEMALRDYKSSYHTVTSLSEELLVVDEIIKNENYAHWSWRESDVLIIDDIMIASVNGKDSFVLSPKEFEKEISYSPIPDIDNLKAFQNKCVIWILGTMNENDVDEWIKMIRKIDPKNKVTKFKFIKPSKA